MCRWCSTGINQPSTSKRLLMEGLGGEVGGTFPKEDGYLGACLV